MTTTTIDCNQRAEIAKALCTEPVVCGQAANLHKKRRRLRTNPSEMPLVSIITVCRNAATTIEAAIRSVADQTYPNLEYIVIDGVSTDGTLEILSRNTGWIDCLISEPDGGIYEAMNKGLRIAEGDYIALLNADDRLFPDFVSTSVQKLLENDADISYGDYMTEDGPLICGDPTDGLLISQLGIKHNTFLIKKECFFRVGKFDDTLEVVADARWNRAALLSNMKFTRVMGVQVFYSTKGISAAASAELRERIIAESVDLLIRAFPMLNSVEAKSLYLSNFNSMEADTVIQLHRTHRQRYPVLASAIQEAMHYNLRNRPGYKLRPNDPKQLSRVIALAQYFTFRFDELVCEKGTGLHTDVYMPLLAALQAASDAAVGVSGGVCMHFLRVFSSPSETFIHDFIIDLAEAQKDRLHVVLCDTRQNTEGRPFPHVLVLPWDALPAIVRKVLYDVIWSVLNPTQIVSHFALNGWKLYNRLTEDQRVRPWVNMCHGIDVFAIGENPEYTEYIRNYCAAASTVVFTCVSSFLTRILIANGVPEEKVLFVPNAVSRRFWAARKTQGFWDGYRPLRIISVGRLIRWKGHETLIRAVASMPDLPLKLEIVYGREDGELHHLQKLCEKLGISDKCAFVEYVDFGKQPDYFAAYDLFVLPSTLSDDPAPRTETFGLALLEAIVAGLPVIGTDAGGIPEVIGATTSQAMIVPHGDSSALAGAIRQMVVDREAVFCDNSSYAKERLVAFSHAARLTAWYNVQRWFEVSRRKIYHFCALGRGGAAGAALGIHRALLMRGYESWFVTREEERDKVGRYMPNVIALQPDLSVDFSHNEPRQRSDFTTFSVDDHAISSEVLTDLVSEADIINLAWPAKFLSVRNVAALTHLGIPVTITLRDMNPITGGCHFFHGCDGWKTGCHNCPQLERNDDNYSYHVLKAKTEAWNLDVVTFVALSDHSLSILEKSYLAAGAARTKLWNFVDTSVFFVETPGDFLDGHMLSQNSFKIGFLPSFNSRIKGHQEFFAALKAVSRARPDIKISIVLASDSDITRAKLPYKVFKVGSIKQREQLRRFYNAVDLVAVPSLEETFSNTTVEALACGTPVVGFLTGVLPEALSDPYCGEAVDIGDHEALATAIIRFAGQACDRARIAELAAERFGIDSRIAAYEHFYRSLFTKKSTPVTLSSNGQKAIAELDIYQQRRKAVSLRRRLSHMHDLKAKAWPSPSMTPIRTILIASRRLLNILLQRRRD